MPRRAAGAWSTPLAVTRGMLLTLGMLIVMVSGLASGGCEALISGEVPAFNNRCAGTDPIVCPGGQYCQGAGCAACETRDLCDHYDNDCNGKVDDGPFSDKDGDGYTFCGQTDPATGRPVSADCDDDDASVHPDATETCNGKDDDCDGVVDDGACAAGQTCVPKTGACIGTASACTPQNCPAPRQCDASTQQCVDINGNLGTACNGDLACQSKICGDGKILTPPVAGAGVCTKPCCRSEDCGTGFVCFGPGTGGNYCVTPASLGRTAAVGSLSGGAACAGGTCRSGLCGADGRCTDTCCADRDCAPGSTCAASTVSGHGTFSCRATGSVDGTGSCNGDADCKSGICAQYYAGFNTYGRCAAPCCGSAACGSISAPGIPPVPTLCFVSQTPRGDGVVAMCAQPKRGDGRGAVGDPCQGNADCYSDRCTTSASGGGSSGFCTDACCVDADCGRAGFVCRPAQGTLLRCVPAQ